MEFEDYYKSLGLLTYPFSVYTAESEIEKSESIYKKPQNYSVIDEVIKGSSLIISGERGCGKTALNLDIGRRKKSDSILLVQLEDFSILEETFDHEKLYRFITSAIAGEFFKVMSLNPSSLWKYDQDERIHLSMYLHEYVPTSTKNQLREQIKKLQNGIAKRIGIKIYNSTRVVFNYGLKALTKVVSDSLTKHFSALPDLDAGNAEYFKQLELEVDEDFTPADRSYYYLEKLCELITKSKINEIILLIDKVDEDPRFKNDAERIAKFIEGIASNNKVMISDKFKIILFVWSTPFNSIKSNVRTQKIGFQTLSWNSTGLRDVASKRLSAFSNGLVSDINAIFDGDTGYSINLLLEMCNENPRDLWHLLDKSLSSQFEIDSSQKITKEAVVLGIEKFVREFNYYEYYPRKANARADTMDIYSYIKHLIKLDSNRHSAPDLGINLLIAVT